MRVTPLRVRRLRVDSGSVLILMPAAVLILLVLAAIALDSAIVFLGEREVADVAAAAANDAVSAGYDERSLYKNSELCLSQARVQQIAEESASARADYVELDLVEATRGISETGHPQVTVLVEGTVNLIFAPAIPGASTTKEVDATAVFDFEQDADLQAMTASQSC